MGTHQAVGTYVSDPHPWLPKFRLLNPNVVKVPVQSHFNEFLGDHTTHRVTMQPCEAEELTV